MSMKKKHYIAKHVQKVAPYEIGKIFEYNCQKYSVPIMKAPANFPSTQKCYQCGHLQKIGGRHTYKCSVCGYTENRHINAAKNLESLAYV